MAVQDNPRIFRARITNGEVGCGASKDRILEEGNNLGFSDADCIRGSRSCTKSNHQVISRIIKTNLKVLSVSVENQAHVRSRSVTQHDVEVATVEGHAVRGSSGCTETDHQLVRRVVQGDVEVLSISVIHEANVSFRSVTQDDIQVARVESHVGCRSEGGADTEHKLVRRIVETKVEVDRVTVEDHSSIFRACITDGEKRSSSLENPVTRGGHGCQGRCPVSDRKRVGSRHRKKCLVRRVVASVSAEVE